jgi:putative redox protein
MHIEVETRNVDGQVTSLGTAEPFTLVVDRPTEGGGRGLGFNGGNCFILQLPGASRMIYSERLGRLASN